MKYFKDTTTNEVFGYDPVDQKALIDTAIANGWQDVTKNWPPAPTLDQMKAVKKSEIRTAFQAAAELPVTDSSGVTWNGGYDSAVKLDAAKRMAQLAGQTTVDFYDVNNTAHTLTLAAADTVILTVGADYQIKFAQKQALMAHVDALPATATQADLDAITVLF